MRVLKRKTEPEFVNFLKIPGIHSKESIPSTYVCSLSPNLQTFKEPRNRLWMRSSRVVDEIYTVAELWVRSSRAYRASDSQCRSRNCLGFDPFLHLPTQWNLRGWQMKQCWIKYWTNRKSLLKKRNRFLGFFQVYKFMLCRAPSLFLIFTYFRIFNLPLWSHLSSHHIFLASKFTPAKNIRADIRLRNLQRHYASLALLPGFRLLYSRQFFTVYNRRLSYCPDLLKI